MFNHTSCHLYCLSEIVDDSIIFLIELYLNYNYLLYANLSVYRRSICSIIIAKALLLWVVPCLNALSTIISNLITIREGLVTACVKNSKKNSSSSLSGFCNSWSQIWAELEETIKTSLLRGHKFICLVILRIRHAKLYTRSSLTC